MGFSCMHETVSIYTLYQGREGFEFLLGSRGVLSSNWWFSYSNPPCMFRIILLNPLGRRRKGFEPGLYRKLVAIYPPGHD